jgi:hypothetical protein
LASWKSQAWSSRASREAKANSLDLAELLKILKTYKTLEQNSKQTYIKEKARKEKDEAWTHTFKLLLCLCVPHLLQEQEHNNIYVKSLSKILRFQTHLFSKNQTWKRNFKHSSIFFLLKSYFFTHTCCKAEWTKFWSSQLVMGSSFLH